jgi:hypothetical protein
VTAYVPSAKRATRGAGAGAVTVRLDSLEHPLSARELRGRVAGLRALAHRARVEAADAEHVMKLVWKTSFVFYEAGLRRDQAVATATGAEQVAAELAALIPVVEDAAGRRRMVAAARVE